MADHTYDASKIKILEGLEAVRKRPDMYIGDRGSAGLHHLVYEVLDNSIDEALAGACDNVAVRIGPDGSCMIEDNGRGIPVSMHKDANVSALEVVLTKLHAGGKFDSDSYKVTANTIISSAPAGSQKDRYRKSARPTNAEQRYPSKPMKMYSAIRNSHTTHCSKESANWPISTAACESASETTETRRRKCSNSRRGSRHSSSISTRAKKRSIKT
ncbi:MAG: ATP-binding protein [Planctomycetota bacterium]|jgi:hypothetical protein